MTGLKDMTPRFDAALPSRAASQAINPTKRAVPVGLHGEDQPACSLPAEHLPPCRASRQTFRGCREDLAHLGRLQLENKVPSGSALAGWAVWERALEISPRCPTALRACLDTDLRK